MAENTKISWCHATFNPWRGCTKVSEACANCYAETMSKRNPAVLGVWGPQGTRVVAAEAAWKKVEAWNRAAEKTGERRRVFPSLCDPFEDWTGPMLDSDGRILWCAEGEKWKGVDPKYHKIDPWHPLTMSDVRRRLFDLIDRCEWLDFLLLTKRPENAERMMPPYFPGGYIAEAGSMNQEGPRPNVWLGVTVENQEQADKRIPHLLKTPAAVRFLSMEPLLGPVNLCTCGLANADGRFGHATDCRLRFIDWVITGGESGPNARPSHPDWFRSLRDQCQAAGVAFFFKQWGEWAPEDQIEHCEPIWQKSQFCTVGTHMKELAVRRVGVKRAGRLLDGREWSEVPRSS